MDKKLLKRLKLKNKSSFITWSDEELKNLSELKEIGIAIKTIVDDEETKKLFFPGRTKTAIRTKYGRL